MVFVQNLKISYYIRFWHFKSKHNNQFHSTFFNFFITNNKGQRIVWFEIRQKMRKQSNLRFTYRDSLQSILDHKNVQILVKKGKPNLISDKPHKLPSLHYFPQTFSQVSIKKLNRTELFEILYQVQEVNTMLKQENGFEMLSTQKILELKNNTNQYSQALQIQQSDKNDDSYKQFERQSYGLEQLLGENRLKKQIIRLQNQQQSRVTQLQYLVSNLQLSIQRSELQKSELASRLGSLQNEIAYSQRKVAEDQVKQKYSKKGQSHKQRNEASDEQSDEQIDWILEELYNKVKGVMAKDAKQ